MKNTSDSAEKKEEVVCFIIENYEEMYHTDAEIITKLEMALAQGGAIPARIDFPSRLCCVTVVNKSLTPKDILTIIEQLGFHAKLSEG